MRTVKRVFSNMEFRKKVRDRDRGSGSHGAIELLLASSTPMRAGVSIVVKQCGTGTFGHMLCSSFCLCGEGKQSGTQNIN